MKRKVCQKCGAVFFGTSIARFCKKCRAERQREAVRNWLQAHKDTLKEYNRQKQQKYYLLHREEILAKRKSLISKGPVPVKEAPKATQTAQTVKCGNYRADNVSCALCAGTGAEKYKACYAEVLKK